MDPGVDLQITRSFRCQPQLDPTIRANQGSFVQARVVLHGHLEEPFLDRPVTNLAMTVIHAWATLYRIEASEYIKAPRRGSMGERRSLRAAGARSLQPPAYVRAGVHGPNSTRAP